MGTREKRYKEMTALWAGFPKRHRGWSAVEGSAKLTPPTPPGMPLSHDPANASADADDLASVLQNSDALHTDIERALAEFPWGELDERRVSTLMLCQIAFEHGVAMRALLGGGLHTSAIALLRLQFEAVVRAAWLLHAATDEQANRLSAPLSLESEQGAKNLPSVDAMIGRLERDGPRGSGALLRRFQVQQMRALNSFVHAGIHPVQRRATGYPEPMLRDLVRISNAVAMLTVVVLSELGTPVPGFREAYLELHQRHVKVLPALEAL